jgi:hypothetical protein
VPISPDAIPAAMRFGAVAGTRQPLTLTATAASTATAKTIVSDRCGSAATAAAPSAVPGSRPARAHFTPPRSNSARSRTAMSTVSRRARSSIGPGTRSRSTMASNGAANVPNPNPTEPCRMLPIATAAAATASSPPLTAPTRRARPLRC